MKNTNLVLVVLMLLFVSCGENKKENEGEKFSYKRAAEKKQISTKKSVDIPIDMNNKGIGPISELKLEAINLDLVAKGEALYNQLCIACHLPKKRSIGPAISGVLKRRSPEWVMNLILNPDEMLEKDPIAKAMLLEYDNARMLNQNLTTENARALVEYIRSL